jgi:enoyl-CoA hydratase
VTSASGVRVERDGDLAVLRLDKARGNAIDEPLLEALVAAASDLAGDGAVRGVLLASAHPKLFCPGLDLLTLVDYDRPAMERFAERLEAAVLGLFELEKPVVAAVSGAAVAGGCLLALTADWRLLREGAPIGLNEVRVGIPLPAWAAALLRASVPPGALTRIALLGENLRDAEAVSLGLAHEVHPAEGFEAAALARLRALADRDPGAVATTKRYLREPTRLAMRAGGAEGRGEFLDAWFSPAGQEKIRATAAALTKKT